MSHRHAVFRWDTACLKVAPSLTTRFWGIYASPRVSIQEPAAIACLGWADCSSPQIALGQTPTPGQRWAVLLMGCSFRWGFFSLVWSYNRLCNALIDIHMTHVYVSRTPFLAPCPHMQCMTHRLPWRSVSWPAMGCYGSRQAVAIISRPRWLIWPHDVSAACRFADEKPGACEAPDHPLVRCRCVHTYHQRSGLLPGIH
jgi:hypothetical protein